MVYALKNIKTGMYADLDCTGEHDVNPTIIAKDIMWFDEYRDASEASQNFGPDWIVDE